jgi:nucleoid-associated protein YgaU
MAIAPLPDPEVLDALTATRPALRLLRSPGEAVGAADPVVPEARPARWGGTSPPARLHRRALVLLAGGLLAALAVPVAALAGTTGTAGSTPIAGTTYVVKPGDTLWSIAAKVDPANPGRLVATMTAETGSASVAPGEHLVVP